MRAREDSSKTPTTTRRLAFSHFPFTGVSVVVWLARMETDAAIAKAQAKFEEAKKCAEVVCERKRGLLEQEKNAEVIRLSLEFETARAQVEAKRKADLANAEAEYDVAVANAKAEFEADLAKA